MPTMGAHQLFKQLKDRRKSSNYSMDMRSSIGTASSVLPGLEPQGQDLDAEKRKRNTGSDQLIQMHLKTWLEEKEAKTRLENERKEQATL